MNSSNDNRINGISHIAIAVRDLDEAIKFWTTVMGGTLAERKPMPDQQVELAFIEFGSGAKIELLQPTDANSPVGRFLAKNGPGLHHVALRVNGIESCLDDLTSKGIQLVDETPRPGAEDDRIAFMHPKSTQGVLIELSESDDEC